ncbi:hypothetical protein ACTFIV_007809 [Dictyostelium citrinum]
MNKSKNNNNKKVVKVEQEKTVEKENNTTTTEIPQEIQDKLNVINDKIKVIFEESKKKMLEVEHKFNQQLKSQFKKRSELLQKSKDFQGFWGTILSKAMIDNFADNDQAVVDCLINIEVETDINLEKDETTKKITLSFKDNSIFKNKQITKEIITDKEGNSTCKNTKIEYTNSTPITTTSTKNNTNNKKRKQVDFAEQSFILTWLQSDDADLDTFEEFSRLYEDPFSILLEEDHDDDDDEDDEYFDGEEDDEEDDE